MSCYAYEARKEPVPATVMDATDRGRPVTTTPSFLLGYVAEIKLNFQ